MGRFIEELEKQKGVGSFDSLKLEDFFPSKEDQEWIQKIRKALSDSKDENERISNFQNLGVDALRILIRLAEKIL